MKADMTVLETVLTLVGAPLAVIIAVTALIYAPSGSRGKRYRPGRDYDFAPVWFLARPENVTVAGAAEHVHKLDEDAPKAIESAESAPRAGVKGGASGNW